MNFLQKIVFLLILNNCFNLSLQIQQLNIGALFFNDELYLQKTFEATVERFNGEGYNFQLLPLIRHISELDGSIGLQREACDLIDHGVVAIFGPSAKLETDIVEQICNSTGIPHIKFDIAREETVGEELNHQMSVNLYPAALVLSKAYSDILHHYGWRKFTVVYDEDDVDALSRLQDVIQMHELNSAIVRVRSFKRNDDYRVVWKSVKSERRIVLDCSPDLLVDVLSAATEFDLTGQFNHIFLTNLNNYNGSLEALRDNETFFVNITAARLRLNADLYNLDENAFAELYNFDESEDSTQISTLLPNLIYDAVNVLVLALKNVTTTYQIPRPRVKCDFGAYGYANSWAMGRYLNSIMKNTYGVNNLEFRTTDLQFDEHGQRINFNIEIYYPMDNYGIAFWNPKGQIITQEITEKIQKRVVYVVATKIDPPYFMEIPEAVENNITGNARYMGYSVDLIEALSKTIGFEYTFKPVPDNAIGTYNPHTKQWSGIIGELVNNDANLGICDLTITQARRAVVDFTVPFMQLGISILAYQKPYEPKSIFAFLEPFHGEVWTYILFATILMSFLFILLARISKDEWENPHPCNKRPKTLENNWGLANCYWLTMASITTAGSDILPRSPPMRSFNAMWWIFAIIIANSYTANMAAFLTQSKSKGTIESVKDLAEQKEVKFGTIFMGSTYTFFAESNETTYRLAFNIMNKDDPSAYTKSNIEGRDRVLRSQGKYMFLMETTALEYNVEKNCELRGVDEKFGEKHYAIGVPLGAEYRNELSVGILKLSEKGELFRLKNKWWKNETRDCGEPESVDSNELTFEGVRGIFYTLFVGVFIAYILGICEFLAYVQDISIEEEISYKEALKRELKFVFCVWNNKKVISCTPSISLRSSSAPQTNEEPKEKMLQNMPNGKSTETSIPNITENT